MYNTHTIYIIYTLYMTVEKEFIAEQRRKIREQREKKNVSQNEAKQNK